MMFSWSFRWHISRRHPILLHSNRFAYKVTFTHKKGVSPSGGRIWSSWWGACLLLLLQLILFGNSSYVMEEIFVLGQMFWQTVHGWYQLIFLPRFPKVSPSFRRIITIKWRCKFDILHWRFSLLWGRRLAEKGQFAIIGSMKVLDDPRPDFWLNWGILVFLQSILNLTIIHVFASSLIRLITFVLLFLFRC